MTNDERADLADAAVRAFQGACPTDDEDAIPDLICNLLHLANRRGEGGITALQQGVKHFLAEALDAPEGMANMRIEVSI